MTIVELRNITKTYGPVNVLNNISLQINIGEKIALVGANGSGKTTLLQIISRTVTPDSGIVRVEQKISIEYLPQSAIFDDKRTLRDELCDEEILRLQHNIDKIENELSHLEGDETKFKIILDYYNCLLAEFKNKGGYDYKARLETIINKIGLSNINLDIPISILSAGQRSRAQLAKILMKRPDLLLLDEPDSHLDISAVEWLEDFLSNYKGTLVIVSHDRYLLEKVTDKTIEIENGKITQYNGNYSYYADQKERARVKQHYDYVNQQFEISRLKESIETLRKWASKNSNPKIGKRVKSMEKRLDRIEPIEKPYKKPKMQLDFSFYKRSGEIVVETVNLSKCFGDYLLFSNVSFQIRWGEHVAIIGPNGSGKTTLIKIILGLEQPTDGYVNLGENLVISYFDQEQKGLNYNKNIYEEIEAGTNLTKNETMYLLSKVLFKGDRAYKKIEDLSGGEKNRVMLTKLIYTKANLMILDEPTNHLDIPSIEVLEESLSAFKGTIILVSHDRHLLNKVSNRVIELEDGKVKFYPEGYGGYSMKTENVNSYRVL
ncbi:MAG: ribosomal protection-like ABC-F family protein [bacterium]